MPRASIVMPAYNAERYVAQAIESVQSQTMPEFELIAINDGSTDGTLAILEGFARGDARIKVYSQPNRGFAESLHRGFELAENDWIFRMDADDRMHPNRLERQLAFLEEHPEVAVASSLVCHIDARNRVIGRDNSRLFTHESIEELLARNEPIGFCHSAVVLRKSAVMAAGGYRKQFWPAEDIDLWTRMAEQGYKMLVQPEYLLDYRIHGSSATVAGARATRVKVRWLKDCMMRRRAGKPELELDAFIAAEHARPLLARLNQERKDLAKVFYKAAVYHYAQRQYARLSVKLLAAFLLQPGYVAAQVSTKGAIGRGAGAVQ